MDKNYAAWIHNDLDPVDEPVDEVPEPPRVRRPARSVVATGTLAALSVAGLVAIASSLGTSETSGASDSQQSVVEATIADHDSGPGAASIEEEEPTADEEPTVEDSTDGESTDVDSTDDDSTDDESTDPWSESPPEPRLIERRQLRPPMGTPPGMPPGARPHVRHFVAQPGAPSR